MQAGQPGTGQLMEVGRWWWHPHDYTVTVRDTDAAGDEFRPSFLEQLDLAMDLSAIPYIVIVTEGDQGRITRAHAAVAGSGESGCPRVGHDPQLAACGTWHLHRLARYHLVVDDNAINVTWIILSYDAADRALEQRRTITSGHDHGHGRPCPATRWGRDVAMRLNLAHGVPQIGPAAGRVAVESSGFAAGHGSRKPTSFSSSRLWSAKRLWRRFRGCLWRSGAG